MNLVDLGYTNLERAQVYACNLENANLCHAKFNHETDFGHIYSIEDIKVREGSSHLRLCALLDGASIEETDYIYGDDWFNKLKNLQIHNRDVDALKSLYHVRKEGRFFKLRVRAEKQEKYEILKDYFFAKIHLPAFKNNFQSD